MSRLATLGLILAALACPPSAVSAHGPDGGDTAGPGQRLPTIGSAPGFSLTAQDGSRLALPDLRGKVVAVAFIYASCADVCPLLTEKMAQVGDELGPDFGSSITFVSITVDPERDTPEVLEAYAKAFGADRGGWHFLTGEPAAVRDVARRYGVAVSGRPGEGVDHTLLTSLVDRRGMLRVQYLGARFDPEELRRDLLELVGEP
ncbi:SCO family protein [Benzoatithermus flavus]|uniref:SCO family protein n=1 Tax=Benzoatithermus flavus TaxID=3108223 RepID=A0ABU8XV60_9PROT